VSWATPPRILTAGWLVFLLYAYPGYIGAEAADQLFDSRVGEITDWHSPMMTVVWRVVGVVISGPAGMLLLQSLLLLVGSFTLLRQRLPERTAAIAACAVLLFPPVLATTGQIHQDAQLAGFVVAGAAALTSVRLGVRLAGLGLLVIACGLPAGGALAVFPIILACFWWRPTSNRWSRLGVAAAASALVVITSSVVVYAVVDVRSERNEVSLAMSDILGTLQYAPDLTDPEARTELGDAQLAVLANLQERARAVYGKPSTYAAGDERFFEAPPNKEARKALYAARRSLALAYPRAYLRHRWRAMTHVLALSRSRSSVVAYTMFVAVREHNVALQHAARHSSVQRWLVAPVRWISRTVIHRPYVYALLALVLLPLALLRRRPDAAALLASGLAYETALLFVTVRVSGTESHLLVVTTLLAAILIGTRRQTAA
jgi:hypothetical protein